MLERFPARLKHNQYWNFHLKNLISQNCFVYFRAIKVWTIYDKQLNSMCLLQLNLTCRDSLTPQTNLPCEETCTDSEFAVFDRDSCMWHNSQRCSSAVLSDPKIKGVLWWWFLVWWSSSWLLRGLNQVDYPYIQIHKYTPEFARLGPKKLEVYLYTLLSASWLKWHF